MWLADDDVEAVELDDDELFFPLAPCVVVINPCCWCCFNLTLIWWWWFLDWLDFWLWGWWWWSCMAMKFDSLMVIECEEADGETKPRCGAWLWSITGCTWWVWAWWWWWWWWWLEPEEEVGSTPEVAAGPGWVVIITGWPGPGGPGGWWWLWVVIVIVAALSALLREFWYRVDGWYGWWWWSRSEEELDDEDDEQSQLEINENRFDRRSDRGRRNNRRKIEGIFVFFGAQWSIDLSMMRAGQWAKERWVSLGVKCEVSSSIPVAEQLWINTASLCRWMMMHFACLFLYLGFGFSSFLDQIEPLKWLEFAWEAEGELQ